MRERRAHREELDRFDVMARGLIPIAARRRDARRLRLNGAPVVFGLKTARGGVAAALDEVRADCESGDRRRMLALPVEADDRTQLGPPLRLKKVERVEAGPDLGAMLCIFGSESGGDTQIRYARAQRSEGAATASVFTVATETNAPLDALFPAGGDAPGDDLPGVPRPAGARREFSASFDGETYGVRIYEAKGTMADVVTAYDAQMVAAGWARSSVVASAFPDARAYTKGPAQVVASFEEREGSAIVSLAALEDTAQAPDAGRGS